MGCTNHKLPIHTTQNVQMYCMLTCAGAEGAVSLRPGGDEDRGGTVEGTDS